MPKIEIMLIDNSPEMMTQGLKFDDTVNLLGMIYVQLCIQGGLELSEIFEDVASAYNEEKDAGFEATSFDSKEDFEAFRQLREGL